MALELAGLYIFSYLIGSIPTAYLIGKLARNVDIRHHGSRNVGGSNLFRHVGKRWMVPLAILDVVIKGSVPIWIGLFWALYWYRKWSKPKQFLELVA